MSLYPLGLIRGGRLDTGGELRQIAGFGAQERKNRGVTGLFGLDTEGLAGPQAPAQVFESPTLVHVVGAFREYCKPESASGFSHQMYSSCHLPIHIPWRLCVFAVSTLWILSASTVKTGVDKREGIIATPQLRLKKQVVRD